MEDKETTEHVGKTFESEQEYKEWLDKLGKENVDSLNKGD